MRPIQDNDTDYIIRWRNSEDIRSQFIFREPLTHEMHVNWLKTKVYTGKVVQYIIELANKPIGSIYIRDIDLQNESGEFGIFIGETDFQGKGYGTLAAKLFTAFCFSLGFHRIFLRVLAQNVLAQRSYMKAGFIQEGTARDMLYIEGKRHDVVFMSMLKTS